MQKARRHHAEAWLRPLVGLWFQVLFHSPIRSTFHLSLTVLVHYRCLRSIQPYQMVLADSHRISLVPCYSGYCSIITFYAYGTITLFGLTFQKYFAWCNSLNAVLQPQQINLLVWALPFSLATTGGISIDFLSSRYLDVSVPRVSSTNKCGTTPSAWWVYPFGYLRI